MRNSTGTRRDTRHIPSAAIRAALAAAMTAPLPPDLPYRTRAEVASLAALALAGLYPPAVQGSALWARAQREGFAPDPAPGLRPVCLECARPLAERARFTRWGTGAAERPDEPPPVRGRHRACYGKAYRAGRLACRRYWKE